MKGELSEITPRPLQGGYYESIVRPRVEGHSITIPSGLLQVIQQNQFAGLPHEDPNQHLEVFVQLCDAVQIDGVTDDAIYLRLFTFSLKDRARSWLSSLPEGSITTWNDLANKFVSKFFPTSRSAKLRSEITAFVQQEGETLYDAWERFKELLRKCLQHSLPEWLQAQTFYNGLIPNTKVMIDAACGGSFDLKTPAESLEIMEAMAENTMNAPFDRQQRKGGMLEVGALDAILAQNKAMSQQLASITKQIGGLQVNSVNSLTPKCGFVQVNMLALIVLPLWRLAKIQNMSILSTILNGNTTTRTPILTIRVGEITRIFPGKIKVLSSFQSCNPTPSTNSFLGPSPLGHI